ncbi:MAG: helix-turn-helix transcriptional regulator [Clostridiales bacterium]|nr:helix-turn-helix transcriptional regulator [Clostridiales bacterium]
MDIKENLARNLTLYRKASNLTQAELAEKLNYSDKAVSKWERGESVPDLYVLKQLADFYNVKIDTLISPPKAVVLQAAHIISKRRVTICLSSIGLVWLVATLCFTTIQLIFPSLKETWLSFFYALPITFIILLIFTAVWKNVWVNTLAISLLVWSTILSLFLTLTVFLPTPPTNLWMLFLVGIPAQILVLLFFTYRKLKR